MNMEIDPSDETLDEFNVPAKVEEGALVLYGKKSIGVMGRCLNKQKHTIILKTNFLSVNLSNQLNSRLFNLLISEMTSLVCWTVLIIAWKH